MRELVETLIEAAALKTLLVNAGQSIFQCLAFGLGMYALERAAGAETRQLSHQEFPARRCLLDRALDGLPSPAKYLLMLVTFDFLSYWVHRWQHA